MIPLWPWPLEHVLFVQLADRDCIMRNKLRTLQIKTFPSPDPHRRLGFLAAFKTTPWTSTEA